MSDKRVQFELDSKSKSKLDICPSKDMLNQSTNKYKESGEDGIKDDEEKTSPVSVEVEDTKDQPPKMSKNQMKKILKREKWQAVKLEKRKQERQRRKQKFADRRERGEDTGPPRKRLKYNLMENSSCKIKIAIDLSLDEYMSEKDIQSMAGQLRHCYSTNRRAENPLQLYFSGSGKTKNRVDEIGDIKGWDVHVEPRPYHEAFPKDSIVYLTSDSPSVLTSLTCDKVYVIGGLVDHNKHKGLCQRLAEEKHIATAQLPIGEFFQMSTRKVLAVNHVYNILVKFTEINNWKQAFLTEMPQRKADTLKEKNQSDTTDNTNSMFSQDNTNAKVNLDKTSGAKNDSDNYSIIESSTQCDN